MTDPAFYREEAERCRQMAALSPGLAAAKRWRAFADEYLQLALAIDEPRNPHHGRPRDKPGEAGVHTPGTG